MMMIFDTTGASVHKKLVLAEQIRSDCAEQRRQTAEDHIIDGCSRQKVGKQTSHKQSRNCRRCKVRQNGQRLGNPDLKWLPMPG